MCYADLFGSQTIGDINVTVLHPGAICAWHRHQRQDDYLFVARGTVKVGLWHDGGIEPEWVIASERAGDVVVISRKWWHGYQNIGTEDAIVVMYLTHKYDPTDEERMSVKAAGFEWKVEPR